MNVAENVPRLILLAMDASVSAIPRFFILSASSLVSNVRTLKETTRVVFLGGNFTSTKAGRKLGVLVQSPLEGEASRTFNEDEWVRGTSHPTECVETSAMPSPSRACHRAGRASGATRWGEGATATAALAAILRDASRSLSSGRPKRAGPVGSAPQDEVKCIARAA